MKREEIEKGIERILGMKAYADPEVVKLTDLFIELSNSRCEEQKLLCGYACDDSYYYPEIVNAPLPEIK